MRWARSIALSTAIWATGAIVGAWAVGHAKTLATDRSAPEAPLDAALLDPAGDPGGASLYFGILGRNLAVYLWLLCGVASAGLSTVAVLAFNGVALGQTAAVAIELGMSTETMLWLLLPHGTPEFGAFLVAGAIGLQGPGLLRDWFNNGRAGGVLTALWRPAVAGALALVAAAGIETGLTVPLAQSMQGVR